MERHTRLLTWLTWGGDRGQDAAMKGQKERRERSIHNKNNVRNDPFHVKLY